MIEQVYYRYYDTAGNYHWIGVHSGEHIVRKGERMTNKEAIEWLERIEERYILRGDEGFDKARKEALHMAIEALEHNRGTWLLDGRCSECLVAPLTSHKNYCPNCGADMRGGSNDGR